MAVTKAEDLISFRFTVMEENFKEIKTEMKAWFAEIFARLDWMDEKYPSMREHFENKEKIKALETKVEGINLRIATWSGAIIIIAYIAQQLIEKWK